MLKIMCALLLGATVALSGSAGVAIAQERKNVNALTPEELADLRRGVAVMKSRDAAGRGTADWRRSWAFWANIHGHFGSGCAGPLTGAGMEGVQVWTAQNAPERNTWCTCQHRSDAFLTWHRIALYYFERVLQQAAGIPTLRMPYWDVSAEPGLPEAVRAPTYVDEAGLTVPNPLYVPNRAAALNAGTAVISAGARSPANAMAATTLATFRQRLENTPHGAVHCAVGVSGCPTGLMGNLSSAGLDPVFWLHHANIDRLYECWVRRTNRYPTGSQLTRTFRFPDSNGAIVASRVGDRLTTAQLGYSYAAGSNCATVAAGLPEDEPAPAVDPAAPRLWLAQGRPRVALPPAATQRGRRPVLRLENVVPDALDPGMYDVYVVAPDGRRALVGVMSFFGLGEQDGHEGHGGPGESFEFDLARAVRDLRLRPNQAFEVVFEATTGLEPAAPAALTRPMERRGAPPRVGRIGVEVE